MQKSKNSQPHTNLTTDFCQSYCCPLPKMQPVHIKHSCSVRIVPLNDWEKFRNFIDLYEFYVLLENLSALYKRACSTKHVPTLAKNRSWTLWNFIMGLIKRNNYDINWIPRIYVLHVFTKTDRIDMSPTTAVTALYSSAITFRRANHAVETNLSASTCHDYDNS